MVHKVTIRVWSINADFNNEVHKIQASNPRMQRADDDSNRDMAFSSRSFIELCR